VNYLRGGDWPVTTDGVTVDPCLWFQLTGKEDDTADPATLANNSHHQGTDWIYGGWDRDVMQAPAHRSEHSGAKHPTMHALGVEVATVVRCRNGLAVLTPSEPRTTAPGRTSRCSRRLLSE
jgi:hypothetical protein